MAWTVWLATGSSLAMCARYLRFTSGHGANTGTVNSYLGGRDGDCWCLFSSHLTTQFKDRTYAFPSLPHFHRSVCGSPLRLTSHAHHLHLIYSGPESIHGRASISQALISKAMSANTLLEHHVATHWLLGVGEGHPYRRTPSSPLASGGSYIRA
jgi:hypothetical protein